MLGERLKNLLVDYPELMLVCGYYDEHKVQEIRYRNYKEYKQEKEENQNNIDKVKEAPL